jgi:hypothetical protein
MSAMFDFSGEDDRSGVLIDNRDAGRFRSGIDLESKIRRLNLRDHSLQNNYEWRETKYGGFASREKLASHRRMARRKRLFVGVQDGDFQINELNFRW